MESDKNLIKVEMILLITFLTMSILSFWADKMHERMMNEQRGQVNKNCVSETRYVIVGNTIRFKK